MASEVSIAFMFLIQTGLALLTVLGASFCVAYHFFSQPTPEPLPREFRSNEWGQRCVPSALHGKSRKLNSAQSEAPRPRHAGKPGPEAVSFAQLSSLCLFSHLFSKIFSKFSFFPARTLRTARREAELAASRLQCMAPRKQPGASR